MSKIDDLLAYALNTPGNLNPSVFRMMAEGLSENNDDNNKIKIVSGPENWPTGEEDSIILSLVGELNENSISLVEYEGKYNQISLSNGFISLKTPDNTDNSNSMYANLVETITNLTPSYKQASGTYSDEDTTKYYSYDSQEKIYTDITNTLHNGDSLSYYYYDDNQIYRQATLKSVGSDCFFDSISVVPLTSDVEMELLNAGWSGDTENWDPPEWTTTPTTKYFIEASIATPPTQTVTLNNTTYTKMPYTCWYVYESLTMPGAGEDFISLSPGWNAFYLYQNTNDENDEIVEVISFTNFSELGFLPSANSENYYKYDCLVPYACGNIFNGILQHVYQEDGGLYKYNKGSWDKESVEDIIESLLENEDDEESEDDGK